MKGRTLLDELNGLPRRSMDMLTVIGFLVIAAFIAGIASAIGKAPLWVSVILLCLVELLRILPLGR